MSEKGNSQLDVWVLTDLLQELPPWQSYYSGSLLNPQNYLYFMFILRLLLCSLKRTLFNFSTQNLTIIPHLSPEYHMHFLPFACFTECCDNPAPTVPPSHGFLCTGQCAKHPKLKPREVIRLQLRGGSWDFEPRQPDMSPFYTLVHFFFFLSKLDLRKNHLTLY